MRKCGLLAAAAGLALAGSVARADFTITSNRVNNGATDTVTFFVQETNSGNTAGFPLLNAISVALYDPSASGLFLTTNSGGKVNAYSGTGSRILPINDGSTFLTGIQTSPAVLNLNGTVNTLGTGYTASSTISASGLGGTIGAVGAGVDITAAPVAFAVGVVPANDTVEILQTTSTGDVPGNRSIFPQFQPAGTEFTATTAAADSNKIVLASNASSSAFVNAVPEPGTLGLVGLAMGGLLARRRRSC